MMLRHHLDPIKRYIYFADSGQKPSIQRANLDGSNKKAIVTENIKEPTDLTVNMDNHMVRRLLHTSTTRGCRSIGPTLVWTASIECDLRAECPSSCVATLLRRQVLRCLRQVLLIAHLL